MMYEELVESSRLCAMGYNGACDGCIFCGKSNDKDGDCYQQLHKAVADAIEELEKFYQIMADAYETEVTKERWIPVTEMLPEESEGLRWCEELTLRFTSVWCCDVNTGTIEVRNRLQGKKTGIDGLDQYMKDEKWHWSHSWWEPTHWMPIVPLPEPPKDGRADV